MSSALKNPAAPAITASRVEKYFLAGGERVRVLRGLDFTLRLGELVMLVGPSGCGKTTLLNLLCGTLRSDGGEIEVLGRRIDTMTDAERTRFRGANLGFVFQQFNLVPRLTALENVCVPLLLQGRPRMQAEARGTALLARVGLGAKLAAFPRELSGGQQQRVAIARALIHEPKLLLADEPTASLDASAGQALMALLKTMAADAGRAVIVVTHDSRIFSYADRIVSMEDGRILSSHAA
jgi:putative ABC transport system ATP-binding protein